MASSEKEQAAYPNISVRDARNTVLEPEIEVLLGRRLERDNDGFRWLVKIAQENNSTGEFNSRSAEVAKLYLELGENQKTLDWFERAYQEHDPWLPMDLASTSTDPLRSDPKFQDLLRRIGLPQ